MKADSVNGRKALDKAAISERLNFEFVVEVAEVPAWKANLFLDNGYKLLGIYRKSDIQDKNGSPVVQHYIRYVCGRAAEVEHYDPPATRPDAEGR